MGENRPNTEKNAFRLFFGPAEEMKHDHGRGLEERRWGDDHDKVDSNVAIVSNIFFGTFDRIREASDPVLAVPGAENRQRVRIQRDLDHGTEVKTCPFESPEQMRFLLAIA